MVERTFDSNWLAPHVGMRELPRATNRRQALHVFYGGARLFHRDLISRLRERALESLEQYAPTPEAFCKAFDLDQELGPDIHRRVLDKLKLEPVEELRIDFEDGYGVHTDTEEDEDAANVGRELALAQAAGTLAPGVGIRIKPLNAATARRALATLDIVVTALGKPPPGFVVVLPKVSDEGEVQRLENGLSELEAALGLTPGTIGMELMVEIPEAFFTAEGSLRIPKLIEATQGRCVGLHFGPYDYTASLGIAAVNQTLDHPACEHARQLLKMSLGSAPPCIIADGPTIVLPIPPHRGSTLSAQQREENRAHVFSAWGLAVRNVRAALASGIYQGWDVHPAQLPARFAANFAYYRQGAASVGARFKEFFRQLERVTFTGGIFDDAATARGLANFFRRALACGALTTVEVEALCGARIDDVIHFGSLGSRVRESRAGGAV